MLLIDVGVDVSKGYADCCFQNPAGSVLTPSRAYDDTPAGHAAVRQTFAELAARHPDARFRIGVECSGGLERNWLALFASLPQPVALYRLNPLAVHRHMECDLHRNGNDALSAQAIAGYLRKGLRRADVPYEPELEGPLTLFRCVINLIDRATQVQNELQSLLPAVHPDLVQCARQGFPQWLLHLLVQAPTAAVLAEAEAATLAQIPYLTSKRARDLIAAAQRSVAALREPETAVVVITLAEEALRLHTKITALKQQIARSLQDDPAVQLLITLPGIGLWTAACLRLECGRLERFHSAAALVAFAGLNPRVFQSGDGVIRIGISRRGPGVIRAALFMAVKTALQKNPPIAAFYERLREQGKTHKQAAVACMAKLLRIAYACVKHGEPFDPERHLQVKARPAPPAAAPPAPEPLAGVGALEAPVSRREAQRRRAAAAPQTAEGRGLRGRGAADPHDNTSSASCPPSRELGGSVGGTGQNGGARQASRP